MKGFKGWIEEKDDVKESIGKLPKSYQKLVTGYKIVFEIGNTLKGDDGHVGMVVNKPKKLIRVAAPWRFGREFALLHECAHLVYEVYMTPELKKEWSKITKATKDRKEDESEEELFCHAFAAYYTKFPPAIHDHEEWRKFIKDFPR